MLSDLALFPNTSSSLCVLVILKDNIEHTNIYKYVYMVNDTSTEQT